MAVEKPEKRLHFFFQGIFNANVFSELAVHSESKIIILTSGPLQGFRLYSSVFQVNRQGGGDD